MPGDVGSWPPPRDGSLAAVLRAALDRLDNVGIPVWNIRVEPPREVIITFPERPTDQVVREVLETLSPLDVSYHWYEGEAAVLDPGSDPGPADAEDAAPTVFDDEWVDRVCTFCDPVFTAADVGFERQVMRSPDGRIQSLLWEATPALFAAAYPESGIVSSYGHTWPEVGCIDFWVNVEHETQIVRLDVEGWNLPSIVLPYRAGAQWHAVDIARVFTRILGLPPLELG